MAKLSASAQDRGVSTAWLYLDLRKYNESCTCV